MQLVQLYRSCSACCGAEPADLVWLLVEVCVSFGPAASESPKMWNLCEGSAHAAEVAVACSILDVGHMVLGTNLA